MNKKVKKKLFKDWYSYLEDIIDSSYFNKLLKFLNTNYKIKHIYPMKKDIFRAFRLVKFKDVKVVIVGQDPYPNKNATGLAFANYDTKIREEDFSPSLLKIKNCVEQKTRNGLYLDFDPTLEYWAKQGVLLLNSSLSVEQYKPGSHTKYWKKFIAYTLKTISEYNNGVIFCLWGNQARGFEKYINKKTSYILKYTHPAYAARKGEFWNCKHFNEINKIMKKNNGEKHYINW